MLFNSGSRMILIIECLVLLTSSSLSHNKKLIVCKILLFNITKFILYNIISRSKIIWKLSNRLRSMERNRNCDDNWFTRDESRKEREALLRPQAYHLPSAVDRYGNPLSLDSILIEAGQRCTN